MLARLETGEEALGPETEGVGMGSWVDSRFAENMSVTDDVRLLNESLGIRKVCLLMLR